ncbi:MAG: endonuclease domain-containing protein [Desulfobacca sp.]|nr:endonuclease domain-containing protein [Desulfobacca sp.]
MLPFNKNLQPFARELRKNPTEAERQLWGKIRRKQLNGYQFYRQKNIGNFIVDFYCPAARLVIEVDGGQHYAVPGRAEDQKRDDHLADLGLTVIRFSDREIFQNMEGVLENILRFL